MPKSVLAALPTTPSTHLQLWYQTAALRVAEHLVEAGGPDVLARYPFLASYLAEAEAFTSSAVSLRGLATAWDAAVARWERALPRAAATWPLNRLLADGLTQDHMLALLLAGLVEVDARFSVVFAALHPFPDEQRLTVGLLDDLLHTGERGATPPGWDLARELVARGLLAAGRDGRPRSARSLMVPEPIWDALSGTPMSRPAPDMRLISSDQFPPLAQLATLRPPDLAERVARAPALLSAGRLGGLVLRGMRGSGRLNALGSISRELRNCAGGVLVLTHRGEQGPLAERCCLLGPLATLLGVLPAVDLELGPGENMAIPALPGYRGPIGILLGPDGSARGPESVIWATLQIPPPGMAERQQHWAKILGHGENGNRQVIEQISAQFHLTGGGIEHAAHLAQGYAALDGRTQIQPADVREACRSLNRHSLDSLATRVETGGAWANLIVSDETRTELHNLAMRCRQREAVLRHLGPGFGRHTNRGVRALLSGPSGTGKTLAARILAADLGLDIYRVDLAAVVDKYVGETERNLSRLFARAEELDVILLLDEGDALLTGRTDVRSANDRYANLETNYLLQRLESYEGVLLVTTNAASRIDSAFQRRMDVHVSFEAPDAAMRYDIWLRHLPRDGHGVEEAFLRTAAARCALTGGQIRNGALHATVLALDTDEQLGAPHLAAAIAREYRKMGGSSPLTPFLTEQDQLGL